MSQRQELLNERMWVEVHKEKFDRMSDDLRALKAEIESLPEGSEARRLKQIAYDNGYSAAEDFFNRFYEPSVGA